MYTPEYAVWLAGENRRKIDQWIERRRLVNDTKIAAATPGRSLRRHSVDRFVNALCVSTRIIVRLSARYRNWSRTA